MSIKKVDLEFHISSMENQAKEYEVRINRLEKDLFKNNTEIAERNIKALKSIELAEKETKRKEEELRNLNQAYQKLFNESNQKDSEKIKKLEEISYLKKLNGIQEIELKELKSKIELLNKDSERQSNEIVHLSKLLANKDFAIFKKKD
jgi:hypothetical protein